MAYQPLSLVLSAMVLVVIYLVVVPDSLNLTNVFGAGPLSSCNDTSNSGASVKNQLQDADEPVDLRLFIGIMTVPSTYERRALLRMAYSLQPRPVRTVVDVRFVLCTIDKEEDRILVSLEIIAHDDIMVVNCTENMNDGKTYAYFSVLPELFAAAPYDFVGKADDDTYYRVATLVESLRRMPRRDAYHGFMLPCPVDPEEKEKHYMSGMGYVVSWDVVEYIAATPELADDHHDWEDLDFGSWLRNGGKNKNMYNEKERMYDYWDREMNVEKHCLRHEHWTDTVVVHQLKDRLKWARTLHFFNVTQGLRPSKMYHIDLENNIYKV